MPAKIYRQCWEIKMNQHDFDKELQDLYQKRKQQIKAPDVALPFARKKNKFISKPTVFMLGGLSAFGLMAIVNQYQPSKPAQVRSIQTVKYVLEISPYEEVEEDNTLVLPQLLPEKPESSLPPIPTLADIPVNHFTLETDINLLQGNIEPIELPHMQERDFLVQPTLRVMPKYNKFDLDGAVSASIELSYQVNKMGDVSDIDIVESSVNRKLEKSSIKALSQWRYIPSEDLHSTSKHYRVLFDFTANANRKVPSSVID